MKRAGMWAGLWMLLTALLLAGSAQAAQDALDWTWRVDASKSSLEFVGTYQGETYKGRFSNFTSDIYFDPRDLSRNHAKIDIRPRSASTTSNTLNGYLQTAEWLNTFYIRTAGFSCTNFTYDATHDVYEAHGYVTLKGVTLPVTLAFKVTYEPITTQGKRPGDLPVMVAMRAHMRGLAKLDRFAFGLGTNIPEETVGRYFKVWVNLTAERKTGEN